MTTTSARIDVGGAHEHVFTNPHGIQFRIGCFAHAVGCRTLGQASTFWTWFPGHAWQIAICGGCREHLGWLFTASDASFHGLILDRLVPLDDET